MNSRKDLCKLASALGGLPVLGCQPDSPAERAGVVYGDILLTVNGKPTPDWTAFIEARSLDSKLMEIELFRDGTQFKLVVQLEPIHVPDPAQLLAELIAERLVPLDLTPSIAPSKPN
jgi:S1-C subfamily serine protease